jgi:type VI secretion system protein ImpH
MAASGGAQAPDLRTRLLRDPAAFEFHQAVRLLERLVVPNGRIRFASAPGLAFPEADVAGIELGDGIGGETDATLRTAVVGLLGPWGELPYWYSERVAGALAAGDDGPAAFFDLFTSRLVELFYQAWKDTNITVDCEQELNGHVGAATFYLTALCGHSSEKDALATRWLRYAGLLRRRPVPVASVVTVLSDVVSAPVEVRQFEGRWHELAASRVSRLDDHETAVLGTTATLGDRIWNPSGKFAVVIGPLSPSAAMRLLPGTEEYDSVTALIRFASGSHLDFNLELVIERAAAPSCVLDDESLAPALLGLNTWIGVLEPAGVSRLTLSVPGHN